MKQREILDLYSALELIYAQVQGIDELELVQEYNNNLIVRKRAEMRLSQATKALYTSKSIE